MKQCLGFTTISKSTDMTVGKLLGEDEYPEPGDLISFPIYDDRKFTWDDNAVGLVICISSARRVARNSYSERTITVLASGEMGLIDIYKQHVSIVRRRSWNDWNCLKKLTGR